MLKCRDVAHQSSDYIDNRMGVWARLRFRFHLFICVYCRRFVKHVRITRDFMHRKTLPEAEPSEIEQVMKSIPKDKQ